MRKLEQKLALARRELGVLNDERRYCNTHKARRAAKRAYSRASRRFARGFCVQYVG